MKKIAQFSVGIASRLKPQETGCNIPDEIIKEMTVIYPEGEKRRTFFVRLPTEDPRFLAIEDLLARNGYTFTNHLKMETPRSTMLTVTLEFEPSDFGHHDWYEVYPSRALADYLSRNEQGLIRNLGDRDFMLSDEENADLLAGKHDARGKIPSWAYDMVTGVGASRIMGTQVNELLASAKFHIPTKPTTVFGLFEWDPQVIFPILSAQCQFCDPKGIPIPIDGDRSYGMVVDGFIQSPVLKYDRSAVEQVLAQHGKPDVAKTREHFGNGPEVADPIILASRRLTAWLMSHDKKLSWKPVEII